MTTDKRVEERKYPICPECKCNTLVGFTPPKEPIKPELLGTPEYVDWERAHLYCSNGSTNCKFSTRFVDLTTPVLEPRYSLTQYHQDLMSEVVEEIKQIVIEASRTTEPEWIAQDILEEIEALAEAQTIIKSK